MDDRPAAFREAAVTRPPSARADSVSMRGVVIVLCLRRALIGRSDGSIEEGRSHRPHLREDPARGVDSRAKSVVQERMAVSKVRISDAALKSKIEDLADAQERGDAEAVKSNRAAVANRSLDLRKKDAREAKDQINLVNGLALIAGAAVVALILFKYTKPWNGGHDAKDTRRAFGWAALIVFGFYAGLGILRWRDGGVLSFIRGKDGRLSTSLLQVGLWTIGVSSALVYFIFLAFYSSTPGATFEHALGGDNLPEEYLLLLGGPFAAAVIARMTIGSKVADQEVQKVDGNAKLLDVIADDDEQANLVDAQFLIFNLVALTWFVIDLINTPTVIPKIPELLVGLTSTSAIAYTAAKGVASNRPVVTSVTRYLEEAAAGAGAIRPGDFIEIRGSNFVPEGAGNEESLARIVVKVGDRDVSPRFILDGDEIRSPSNTWIVARVPQTTKAGDVSASVVTAAGIEAEKRDFTVVEDKPIITGVDPPAAKTGKPITVHGRFFRVPNLGDGELPSARFGKTVVQARSLEGAELKATVPAHLAAGTVDLAIRAGGGTTWSDPVPLRVQKSPLRRR